MHAAPFDYLRVDEVEAAIAALERHGDDAHVMAGGQSLLPAMVLRMARPGLVIDIGRIEALRGIEIEEDTLSIGACVRYTEALESPLVATHAPLLTQAIPFVAHEAVRNRGTIGGSLATADPASEMAACMIAFDATLVLISARGRREIRAQDFMLGAYATALEAGEIVAAVRIPVTTRSAVDSRQHFREVARRSGDYAIAGGALTAKLRDDMVETARLVLFAVSDRAVLVQGAADALVGRPAGAPDREALTGAIDAEVDFLADTHNGVATKRHLARVLAADLATRRGAPHGPPSGSRP